MNDFDALLAQEHKSIEKSRQQRGNAAINGSTQSEIKAVCLSGGGVRSATFATGIFNGLLQKDSQIVRNIDYLSTVSGGGYFGAFYGQLFNHGRNINSVCSIMANANSDELKYLKHNGRYLAKSGDDAFTAAAIIIRNLLWLHFCLALLLLPVFMLTHYFQTSDTWGFNAFLNNYPEFTFPFNTATLPLTYIPAVVFTSIFLMLSGWYFIRTHSAHTTTLRRMNKATSKILLLTSISWSIPLLCTTTEWLLSRQIIKSYEGGIFPTLYGLLFFISASIYRIQQKIQKLFGSILNFKAMTFGISITIVVVYLITISAFALLYSKHFHGEISGRNIHNNLIELGIFILIYLTTGWLITKFTETINHTSLHYFFAARLRHAYLGAANPARTSKGKKIRNRLHIDNDDVNDLTEYQPTEHGGPLHIINVTLNNSQSPDDMVWWPDCKGQNLALSSIGYNWGHSHQLWPQNTNSNCKTDNRITPDRRIPCISTAIAISGAAASTGMGQATTIASSLLTSIFNIRTGYWWPYKSEHAGFYSCYLTELCNQFSADDEKHWYLSDGGHFENLAVYEMIRRKVSRILVIDASCDPQYQFEDLANLIRRARLDLQCELSVISPSSAPSQFYDLSKQIGELNELKPVSDGVIPTKRAALLKGVWPHQQHEIWLLYVKPTLTGHEPVDVRHYQFDHQDFPHQTTADQFFDEAQWESYRKLGEVTAKELDEGIREFFNI